MHRLCVVENTCADGTVKQVHILTRLTRITFNISYLVKPNQNIKPRFVRATANKQGVTIYKTHYSSMYSLFGSGSCRS
ncbi:hypothetical protein L1987_77665 [Smallanthus sonchifolius]|uniref:Uncharacterized protein n=1 Tax=Smallanthus sonchifolius TaxID=185202 RepID=A0ACB8ZB11_9ASTR|nr:hypothetical protein L1987_77665 [Smallanthus sonchifolius]